VFMGMTLARNAVPVAVLLVPISQGLWCPHNDTHRERPSATTGATALAILLHMTVRDFVCMLSLPLSKVGSTGHVDRRACHASLCR
jgi:hypothetical protein